MTRKTLTITLIAVLLTSTISTVWALQIERPDYWTPVKKLIGKGDTDGNASVSLGVFVDRYDHDAAEYGGAGVVVMNVSMIGNSRMGVRYVYENETAPEWYWWMREGGGTTLLELEFPPNCGDNNGTWVNLPWDFDFLFYGGKYINDPYENVSSKVWVCTNGFISFDLSNSTQSYCYSIPNPTSPNAVIAPLWTDLVIDNQSKIIIMVSVPWMGVHYLVVIWKNALHKFSLQRLTFAVALQEHYCYDIRSPIYMYYQNVTSIGNTYFTYGVEDHEGRKGAGRCAYGNELAALNGTTLIFYPDAPSYFIKHMMLTFEDQSWPNVRYEIKKGNNDIRGYNLKTKIDPPPQQNEMLAWSKPIIGASNFLLGLAGAGIFWIPYITMPVSFGLIAWGFYDAYILHQYNNIEWLELNDSGVQCAYIKVPASSDAIVDASLDVVFYWILDPPDDISMHHDLTITAIVEYEDYESGELANATTSVNIEIDPDNNNSFETAYEIQEGTYGEDPMLWLGGGYDTKDFYTINLGCDFGIDIKMYPPTIGDFDLYLYDSSRHMKQFSEKRGGGVIESINYKTNSAGWWFIEVRYVAGVGFYNLSIQIDLPRGCPFVYVWDGQQYIIDNNLLPTSLKSNGTDVEDYYKLEQTLIPTQQGTLFSRYSLQIREFENEHSYIDQVKLLAVDHNPDFKIAVTPDGEIVNYWQPLPPITCIDNNGKNRLNEILFMDGNVSNPATHFNGATNDYLILNFGQINTDNAKLILRSDRKCEDPPYCCITIQILNNSEWQTVATIAPREYWATEAVNLTPYTTAGQDLIVKLYWTLPHRLDYVGLDTSPSGQMRIISVPSIKAIHSTQGDITAKLLFDDEIYAKLFPNEQIQLTFILPNNPPTKTRTFILYTNGYYYTITE